MIELACWRLGSDLGRIEIPIDIIRIECLDPPTVRTADGIVYRTVSNADMIESKVLAFVGLDANHTQHVAGGGALVVSVVHDLLARLFQRSPGRGP